MLTSLLLLTSLLAPAQVVPPYAAPAAHPLPHTTSHLQAEETEFLPGFSEPADHWGIAGKSRPGRPFTKKQKQIVKQENALVNEGKNRCENCGVETVPGQKHTKGVTPPRNETQVDHVIPKAGGGDGHVDNAQILCRDCNIKKGTKMPEGNEDHGTR